jgi:hypothetical protein
MEPASHSSLVLPALRQRRTSVARTPPLGESVYFIEGRSIVRCNASLDGPIADLLLVLATHSEPLGQKDGGVITEERVPVAAKRDHRKMAPRRC